MGTKVDLLTVADSCPPAEADAKDPRSSAPEADGEVGAAEDQSRQVEAQTSPSAKGTAIADAPESPQKEA